ncbi:metal ABC transporter substrate-binding protein [uncultured Desulfovibrio sp.]|uniref:metal ABC transporter substrate-binding protein n=1 Tax=uncultured Desulfovibrio sp. TaxID=167968 RepID=UPI00280572B8|nr:metal ABC transporter substrate-binding protein [uncultured Desulfovibrio sp.]
MSTRRCFALAALVCVLLCALACPPRAVRAAATPPSSPGTDGGFTVLAATFPLWLFTRNVCRDVPGARVELFVPARTGCPHGFSPSPADLRKLAGADAIVINGLGLEAFLARPVRALDREHAVIDASRGTTPLPAPEEAGDGGHGAPGVNPHIFASPAQAARMARAIGEGLARRDPAHADAYLANASAYADRLETLAADLAAIGKNAPRTGIVLQHDDLAYLAHDAGLQTLAVLRAGDESATPSAARLNALTHRLAAERAVLIAGEPPVPDRGVELLARESGIPWALLDPVSSGPENAPLDYYERSMRANAQTLRRYFDVR